MAFLDSGCPKTVCGEVWLEVYMDSLKEKPNVTQSDSNEIFKFGNGRSIKSNRKVEIPVIIEGIPVLLTTDVISFDIPLLLSKESMKRANTVIDFKNDLEKRLIYSLFHQVIIVYQLKMLQII